MEHEGSLISASLAELKKRGVIRAAGAYALVAWIVLQLAEVTFEPLHLPDWAMTLVVILAILGFPLILMISWFFDFTEGRLKKADESASPNLKKAQVIILLVIPALFTSILGILFYHFYASDFVQPIPITETVTAIDDFQPPGNSIAVLPFDDFSEAGDQAYFAYGLAEELLNQLTQVSGLKVTARTSSFSIRERASDIKEIGRLLNVEAVLEGSVRKQGDRLRITAQLIDTRSGDHLWSEVFDRNLDDIFQIQDEVAASIVRLFGEMPGENEDKSYTPSNLQAYEAYLKGRHFLRKRTGQDLVEASKAFKTAIQEDNRFALAYSGLADTYILQSQYGDLSQAEAVTLAQPNIEEALRLDPELAEAWASLGLLRWQLGQLEAAEGHLRKAVKLNESYAVARTWLAGMVGEQGRLQEQFVLLREAWELDPLHPVSNINLAGNYMARGEVESAIAHLEERLEVMRTSTPLMRTLSHFYVITGDYEKATSWGLKALELQPDDVLNLINIADMEIQLGLKDQAREMLDKGFDLAPKNSKLRYLDIVWNLLNKGIGVAEQQLQELSQGGLTDQELKEIQYIRGMIALYLKRYDESVAWFEKAIDEAAVRHPGFDVLEKVTTMAFAYRGTRNKAKMDETRAIATRLLKQAHAQGFSPAILSVYEAALAQLDGKPQEALQKLQGFVDAGFHLGPLFQYDPRFSELHETEDFKQLLETSSLPAKKSRDVVAGMLKI